MENKTRLLLSARRSGGQDDRDADMAEALAYAQGHPVLAEWARGQQRTDAALAAKLRQVQPPQGLRDTILAGAKVSRRRSGSWFKRRAFGNFRMGEMLAAVAILLLIGVALVSQYAGYDKGHGWQAAAVAEVEKIEHGEATIDHQVADMPDIRAWLAAQSAPVPGDTMPAALAKLGIYGCSKRTWQGQAMTIVCFKLGPGKDVHLIALSNVNLADAPGDAPEYSTVAGYTTASWSEGSLTMMITGKVTKAELVRLFQAQVQVRLELRKKRPSFV